MAKENKKKFLCISVIGLPQAGKTCLLKVLKKEEVPTDYTITTKPDEVNCEFKINQRRYRIKFYDCSGTMLADDRKTAANFCSKTNVHLFVGSYVDVSDAIGCFENLKKNNGANVNHRIVVLTHPDECEDEEKIKAKLKSIFSEKTQIYTYDCFKESDRNEMIANFEAFLRTVGHDNPELLEGCEMEEGEVIEECSENEKTKTSKCVLL